MIWIGTTNTWCDTVLGISIGIEPSDPRWVGAWWLPFIVGTGLCFLAAIPLAGLPVDLPGQPHLYYILTHNNTSRP